MTNETVPIIREVAQFLVQLVSRHVYPAEYNSLHTENGRRFDVIVREHHAPDDTQPMRRVDEDDLIAD